MGWIGWTEEQTLATDIRSIVLAYEGRLEMLRHIFGSGEPSEGDAPSQEPIEEAAPISQESMMAIFRAHNAHPERERRT